MAERVPLEFSALQDVTLEIEPSALGGWTFYANGEPIKPKRNKLSVPRPDGSVAEIIVKPKFDMSAEFHYQAETQTPLPGIPAPLLVVAALPMGLVAVGGALGGALGGLAFAGNIALARSKLPMPVRVLVMLLAGFAAAGLWYVVAEALRG